MLCRLLSHEQCSRYIRFLSLRENAYNPWPQWLSPATTHTCDRDCDRDCHLTGLSRIRLTSYSRRGRDVTTAPNDYKINPTIRPSPFPHFFRLTKLKFNQLRYLSFWARLSQGFIHVTIFQDPMTVNLTLMLCATGQMIQIISQTSIGSERRAARHRAGRDHPGITRQVQVTNQSNPRC